MKIILPEASTLPGCEGLLLRLPQLLADTRCGQGRISDDRIFQLRVIRFKDVHRLEPFVQTDCISKSIQMNSHQAAEGVKAFKFKTIQDHSKPLNIFQTTFVGMNIHLPAILVLTMAQGFKMF